MGLSFLGKDEDALGACEEAIRVDPKYATAWAMKAVILGSLGSYEEMSVAGLRALEIDPTNPYAIDMKEVIQEWNKYLRNPLQWRPPK
jgi:tetratricopeptide (TPR) repeat protein